MFAFPTSSLLPCFFAAGVAFYPKQPAQEPEIPPLESQEFGADAQEELHDPAELSSAERAWSRLLARNERVGFTRRSAAEASLRLRSRSIGRSERIEALMAIGCSVPQSVRDRPFLEEWALEGTIEERGAALLALGEFGEGAGAALLLGLEDPSLLVRGCALLGLLRSGRRTSRIRVEAVAAGSSADAAMARDLLVTAFNPVASVESQVARFWLDLRWGAARRFGLVDGEPWKSRLLNNLLEMPEFLDALILMSAAERPRLGTRDHLLSHLAVNRSEIDIRAAVLGMPAELALLIESGMWSPKDSRTWQMILEEIDASRSEERALALLLQGMMVPEAALASMRLVVRTGLSEVLLDLEQTWYDLNVREKEVACQAWAMAGDESLVDPLLEFRDDSNPRVRAQVLVALARLGHAESHFELRTILLDPEHQDYTTTLRASLMQADGPLVRGYLEEVLKMVEGEAKIDVASALALNGNAHARQALAAELVDGFPSGRRGVRCIAALTRRDPSAHLDLILHAFPVEADLQLNIALARALVRAQHSSIVVLLRHALWTGPFDRSVLAAQVIAQVGGLHTLRDELNRAPLDATQSDMRRLGFALGEWGGLREIKRLEQMYGRRGGNPILQGALLGALGQRTH